MFGKGKSLAYSISSFNCTIILARAYNDIVGMFRKSYYIRSCVLTQIAIDALLNGAV